MIVPEDFKVPEHLHVREFEGGCMVSLRFKEIPMDDLTEIVSRLTAERDEALAEVGRLRDEKMELEQERDEARAQRDEAEMTDNRNRRHPKVVELLQAIDGRLGVIVSAITDFHDTVKGLLDGIATDLTNIENKLGSINSGALSPSDQASLADVTKMVTDLKTRADSDALPAPAPTPAPTVPGT